MSLGWSKFWGSLEIVVALLSVTKSTSMILLLHRQSIWKNILKVDPILAYSESFFFIFNYNVLLLNFFVESQSSPDTCQDHGKCMCFYSHFWHFRLKILSWLCPNRFGIQLVLNKRLRRFWKNFTTPSGHFDGSKWIVTPQEFVSKIRQGVLVPSGVLEDFEGLSTLLPILLLESWNC